MILHDINNKIITYNPYSMGAYPDEFENLDINQEINIVLGWNQNQRKFRTCGAH